jgi:hypothetical protein
MARRAPDPDADHRRSFEFDPLREAVVVRLESAGEAA